MMLRQPIPDIRCMYMGKSYLRPLSKSDGEDNRAVCSNLEIVDRIFTESRPASARLMGLPSFSGST
jgi:hypothetical protein